LNGQQLYIEQLKSVSTVPIQVAALIKKSDDLGYKPGYRYSYGKYEIHDERNVLMNEIVFDFDWSSYIKNYNKAKLVVEALENRNIPYYIYATGGKGIHIHIYFNKLIATNTKHKELLKEANSYGFIPKHIRLWFWNLILEEAGIDEKFRGKYVDSQVIKFDYFAGSSHLIRDCGGRKITKKPDESYTTTYKTYISKDTFNNKKISVNELKHVKYPVQIESFDIDIIELCSYLSNFIKTCKDTKIEPFKNEYLKIKYSEMDSILKLKEGTDSGNRSKGAFLISVACRIDQLPKKETLLILDEYVNNCDQVGHKFTLHEAENWMNWVYAQEKVFWNCSQLDELGVHDSSVCEFCCAKNKKANDFLNSSKLLQKIKKILDDEIVGEDDIKMLIFLLLLSKDFPSETGMIDWNIPSDPMSQNIILASDSSSGKTYVAKKILKLFGIEGEDYHVISRMSKSVINYYTEENMDGKILFVEEMQGLDENTSQLRVWMSEGKLAFDTVEKVINEEGIEVNSKVRKTTKGQPCFLTCQAEGMVGDQLNNRNWLISLDVSENQTRMILKHQTDLNKGILSNNELEIRTIRDALKQLKPYHFIINFLDEEFMKIPTNDVRARRDYMKFITLIKCSAYLHQKQREIIEIEGKEFIKCDIIDYDIAKQYSHNILGATFSGLTVQQIDIITLLKKSSWKDSFSVYDLQRLIGKSHTHWHGQLAHLENLGYLNSEKSLGKTTLYTLNEEKALDLIELPDGEALLKHMTLNSKSKSYQNINIDDCKFYYDSENRFKVPAVFIYKNEKQTLKNQPGALIKNRPSLNNGFSKAKSEKILRSEDILKFIKSSKSHLIEIEDIAVHFKQNIDTFITSLIKAGAIYEPKPGRVMIL